VTAIVGVIDKLDFLVRFWELRARSERMGEPLAASEQVELLSLMQLVTSASPRQGAGPVPRDVGAIPAQIIGEGEILAIEVRSVTAAAILIASSSVLTVGARVIVRIADAVTGIELALPCEVTWAYRASPCTMALAVDGIPTRSEFLTSAAGAGAGTTMRFGPRSRQHASD
jgi:hypothetical protein